MRAPLAAVPKRAVVRVLSGPNRGFRWCVGAADHGCWLGSYELIKQQAIWRRREAGTTVLDVGANVGYYTLLLARAVGPTGRVIAIEPDRRNVAWLRWHMRANQIHNVRTILGAVASYTGNAAFSPGASNTTGHLITHGPGKLISSYRLDDIVFGSNRDVPSIVKMDIEGGEADALLGAEDLLAARRTTWFVALHSRQQAEACIAAFRRHDYRLYSLDGNDVAGSTGRKLSEVVAVPNARIVMSGIGS
jgi:FkbM family methyltransferase